MLGKYQLNTGERLSPRRLAQIADVPKDLVYRLDAGAARYVDLQALARLCSILGCQVEDLLVWQDNDQATDGADPGHRARPDAEPTNNR